SNGYSQTCGNNKKTTVQGFYERNIKEKDGYISTLDQLSLESASSRHVKGLIPPSLPSTPRIFLQSRLLQCSIMLKMIIIINKVDIASNVPPGQIQTISPTLEEYGVFVRKHHLISKIKISLLSREHTPIISRNHNATLFNAFVSKLVIKDTSFNSPREIRNEEKPKERLKTSFPNPFISSEEYIERSQEARSIIARGLSSNEDSQAFQIDKPDDVILATRKKRRVNGNVSKNDQTHLEDDSVSHESTPSLVDQKDECNILPTQKEPPPEIVDYYELANKSTVQDDGFRTPPHQIVSNTYNPEISINENILRMSAMNLAKLDESKYFGEFIPYFIKYKNSQKNNPFSGNSGFAKFLSVDDYIELLSKKPKRRVELPEGWRNVIEEYYKETTESGSVKSISDWIRITEELGVVKEEDNRELIKLKKYLNRVMLPLIESFSKQVPDISAPDSSEHHYWSEFGHHFFSRALQEFVDLDWRAMEAPVQASKYRKNYGNNHIIDTVVDGKYADLLARMWKTGEEIFVGEQAGPPTRCDLTKLATDSFKLYREMRDCLNVRILRAMGKGDVNYNNRSVFGILGFLFEIKMFIMWKDGAYIYEEYGSLNIASNLGQISEMKSGILRLLEFMMIIKTETKNNVETELENCERALGSESAELARPNKSSDKASQSHKKKGTENIVQVIVDGMLFQRLEALLPQIM
ncbi:8382_t:CDS:10, partial [Acaulospora morrowiae]